MIRYAYPEEREVALTFARELNDKLAQTILERGSVVSRNEADQLSNFFWHMVELSAARTVALPCEGSAQFWTEKLLNSLSGYLNRAGYGASWDEAVDRA